MKKNYIIILKALMQSQWQNPRWAGEWYRAGEWSGTVPTFFSPEWSTCQLNIRSVFRAGNPYLRPASDLKLTPNTAKKGAARSEAVLTMMTSYKATNLTF